MKRLESIEDEMRDVVTYELPNGRYARFDARAVRDHGVTVLMRAYDLDQFIPTKRLPVFQYGRRVGTMPPNFDPVSARSKSFLYDVRPGDFRREGDSWVVGRTLGASDLDCVEGFLRDGELAK